MSRTRIVATIGPVTNNPEMIGALAEAGMNVARLNGSHSDLQWHRETIRLLRDTVPDVPILFDIPGRKIRTTQLVHEPEFDKGDVIVITSDSGYQGDDKVPVSYADLHADLKVGETVLADDDDHLALLETGHYLDRIKLFIAELHVSAFRLPPLHDEDRITQALQ